MTDPRSNSEVLTEQHSVGMLLTEHNTPPMHCKNVLPEQTGMCAHTAAAAGSRDRALLPTTWEIATDTRGSCDLNT